MSVIFAAAVQPFRFLEEIQSNQFTFAPVFRKLLREDQLEAVTKAAQQEELERRKRLEQQRKDYPASIPTVPLEFLPGKHWEMPAKARVLRIEAE